MNTEFQRLIDKLKFTQNRFSELIIVFKIIQHIYPIASNLSLFIDIFFYTVKYLYNNKIKFVKFTSVTQLLFCIYYTDYQIYSISSFSKYYQYVESYPTKLIWMYI